MNNFEVQILMSNMRHHLEEYQIEINRLLQDDVLYGNNLTDNELITKTVKRVSDETNLSESLDKILLLIDKIKKQYQ